jgi:lipopolysaccharide transport system ATP-binding protein
MSSEVLIRLAGASKTYPLQRQPGAELAARLLGRAASTAHRHALHPVDLEVRRGEAVGIVGLNGAGKSTLLQLAAGVLSPSAGQVEIKGRVAALLELGSAFDLEAPGWVNIGLYAATLGVSAAEIERRRDCIIDFSGLRDFIHAPVKCYSTGMQVRLAFSVATAVDPDVLIIDEALSVGDGVFAKRSFDRIMELRQRGAALLLSSHALFHVDLFCQHTLWLHCGAVRASGETPMVLPRYQEFLDQQSRSSGPAAASAEPMPPLASGSAVDDPANQDPANQDPQDPAISFELAPTEHSVRLISAKVSWNGQAADGLTVPSALGLLAVDFEIQATAEEPSPRAAVVLSSEAGRILGSALSPKGAFEIQAQQGHGRLRFEWADAPLNRGRYRIGVYVLCSQGRFVYAWSDPHAQLQVQHDGPHQGAWILPGQWLAPHRV